MRASPQARGESWGANLLASSAGADIEETSASGTRDSLGPVDLMAERARRERTMATSPSASFDPSAMRPDTAVHDSIHRSNVLLRRGIYHPM